MVKVKNETGSTLVVTLLIITIILIFSSVLVTNTISSTKQFLTSKQTMQLTHLAEMGLDYFRANINDTINDATVKTQLQNSTQVSRASQAVDTLRIAINSRFTSAPTAPTPGDPYYTAMVQVGSDPNQYYKIKYNITTPNPNATSGTITVNYKFWSRIPELASSAPDSEPYEEKSFSINWTVGTGASTGGGGTTAPLPDNPNKCTQYPIDPSCSVYNTNPTTTIPINTNTTVDNLYTQGTVSLTNKAELNVQGSLYVNGTTSLDNHTVINIQNGNAYFKNIESFPNSSTIVNGNAYVYGNDVNDKLVKGGNATLLCVNGNINLSTTSNIKPSNVSIFSAPQTCSDFSSGIWAKGVATFNPATQPFPGTPSWAIPDPSEIIIDPNYK
jgi:hypothetical protein